MRVSATLDEAQTGIATVYDERLYLADSETIAEVIRELGGATGAVMVSGHNPGLQDLLLELVAPEAENALFDEAALKFPTGSFAVLELAIDDWAGLGNGQGKLVHFMRPRDLDPSLGPERVS